jgi:hypothetical protein
MAAVTNPVADDTTAEDAGSSLVLFDPDDDVPSPLIVHQEGEEEPEDDDGDEDRDRREEGEEDPLWFGKRCRHTKLVLPLVLLLVLIIVLELAFADVPISGAPADLQQAMEWSQSFDLVPEDPREHPLHVWRRSDGQLQVDRIDSSMRFNGTHAWVRRDQQCAMSGPLKLGTPTSSVTYIDANTVCLLTTCWTFSERRRRPLALRMGVEENATASPWHVRNHVWRPSTADEYDWPLCSTPVVLWTSNVSSYCNATRLVPFCMPPWQPPLPPTSWLSQQCHTTSLNWTCAFLDPSALDRHHNASDACRANATCNAAREEWQRCMNDLPCRNTTSYRERWLLPWPDDHHWFFPHWFSFSVAVDVIMKRH